MVAMNKRIILQPSDIMNDLTIISVHHKDKRARRFLLCRCVCGKEKVIQGSLITSGNTKSCGCRVQKAALTRLLPNNQGVINHLILQYKRHAKRRNIPYNLAYTQFESLIGKPCYYCGLPPSNIKITKNCKEGFIYSGIDRIDSTKDYSWDNVVSCCADCNRSKNNMSLVKFQEWVQRLNAMASQWSDPSLSNKGEEDERE